MSAEAVVKAKMDAVLDHFRHELKNLRSNRANPGVVEGVLVDAYGSSLRLKEVAQITTPEPRQILISPFDPQLAMSIAKGIEKANLNLQPVVEGPSIRIHIPPMDKSTRQETAKQAKQKGEVAKVALREVRRESNDDAKQRKQTGELTEDEEKRLKKIVQDFTDHYGKQIDDLVTAKEKEIMAF